MSLCCRTLCSLRTKYGLDVFLEPGAAFVRSAGYLVATVLDRFASGGKDVVVLDTTVNHMPELLEFDFEPDVADHDEGGELAVHSGRLYLPGWRRFWRV